MTEIKKWYLAGPMTGFHDHNYPEFAKWSADLRRRGFDIVSPHELNAGEEALVHTNDEEVAAARLRCMRKDLQAMIDCDGIILLPGWQRSQGAVDEFECARRLGLEILFLDYNGSLR
jgi:nucleoside 2-deoxyribosyltransferase